MKTCLFLIALLLFAFNGNAQISTDSSVIIKNESLYSVKKPENLNIKGQIDAAKHYRRYKAAATGTLITSLVSPLIGLVPAVICSATNPKLENLGYPNEELFRQPEYYHAYTKKAKKIKQRKVWANWGIGLGVNLMVIVLVSTR
jgi:hypothetical protein